MMFFCLFRPFGKSFGVEREENSHVQTIVEKKELFEHFLASNGIKEIYTMKKKNQKRERGEKIIF